MHYEDELAKLHEAATPGPWYADHALWMGTRFGVCHSVSGFGEAVFALGNGIGIEFDAANAELAARQRNKLPEVIAVIRAAREANLCPLRKGDYGSACRRCMDALDAALAALDAKEA